MGLVGLAPWVSLRLAGYLLPPPVGIPVAYTWHGGLSGTCPWDHLRSLDKRLVSNASCVGNVEGWHPIGIVQASGTVGTWRNGTPLALLRDSVQCGERTRLAREAWRTLCWCSWWVFPGPIAFLHSLSVLVNTAALSLRFIYLLRKLYRKTHTRFPVCWFTPQIPESAGVE